MGTPEYYIFNIYPGPGFVIVSADDAAHPILGYSSEGYYDVNIVSPEFSYWMQHYKKQLDYIRLNNYKPSEEIRDEWTAYKNNLPLKSDKMLTSTVNPLLKTVWAQEPYFNANCPDGDVAGCIATAMGQVMKYWAYPPHGIGSHSYIDGSYGSLYANLDSTQYYWSEMPSNVSKANPAVAALTYDIGISVDMRYSPDNSGSFMISADSSVSAQSAFVQYFGYNGSSIQGLFMSNYTYSNWVSMLENELNNNRPLMYAGQGDSGGHAWVCDGYDGVGDFHMNWGWGGYEDGYYNLDALNPDKIPLNNDEEALIGIQPNVAKADFNTSAVIIHAGDTIQYYDNSFGTIPITSWQWSFSGGTPANSATANNSVIYNNPGTYNVSETVSNSNGNNTLSYDSYIIVLPNNPVDVYPTLNDGTFNVVLHDGTLDNTTEFYLCDMLGRKIYTTTLVQNTTEITVFVPHGMYIYRAYNSSGKPIGAGKLMIQ